MSLFVDVADEFRTRDSIDCRTADQRGRDIAATENAVSRDAARAECGISADDALYAQFVEIADEIGIDGFKAARVMGSKMVLRQYGADWEFRTAHYERWVSSK